MNKKFGFWTLTFLVIANMIGAGVFTTSGYALNDLGSPSLVMLAWFVGGLIAIGGAVGYGELIKAMPESGGEYLFLSRAASPRLGFIAGWVSMIAGFSGSIALAATAFESYALPSERRPAFFPIGVIAIASIVFAGILHGVRAKAGAWLQNAIVILKLILLGALLAFAASKLPLDESTQLSTTTLAGWALVRTFATSLVWISLSYAGFNAAVYIAEEVPDAERKVPRSLLAGTSIALVIYMLLNAVFVYLTPSEMIKGRPDVAAIAASWIGGKSFETFVRLTTSACLFTSVFSMMMAAPRVYAKMAEDGLMPSALRFEGDAPRAATILQVVLASVLVLVSSLRDLLQYLGLTLSLCSALSVGCLFLPKVRKKPLWHPSLVLAAVYVLATVVSAFIMCTMNWRPLVAAIATFAIGALAYQFRQSR